PPRVHALAQQAGDRALHRDALAGPARTHQEVKRQQVNTAVNQMDQVVQQNAAMVEEQTAATHALKTETSELSALISRFKVVAGKAVGRSAPRAADASDRAAPSPARAMARKVAASVGGASAADDEWSEF
ncbi:MAG: hypothetical protein E8A12_04305, partial [Phenylobacterium sp.]